MANGGYKLFIVEGETREVNILESVKNFFFNNKKVKFITLPACSNIYMLWKTLKDDDFETDLFEVLKEKMPDNNELADIKRNEIDEIFLFFDYDAHHNNLNKNIPNKDVLLEMLDLFSNETEFGKLYISYPMIESIRDFDKLCYVKTNCIIKETDFLTYKHDSSINNEHLHIKKYDKDTWIMVLTNFVLRCCCLYDFNSLISYDFYKENISPKEIFYKQLDKYIYDSKIFVLSAIPEFILDYFKLNFWKSMIKTKNNIVTKCNKNTI